MAKILRLPVQTPEKFGFERAKKRKKKDPEGHGQLNLFSRSAPASARIVSLPSRLGPFEEALLLDERDNSKAAEAYGRAIEAGDCIADAYCNLGILEFKLGRTEKAFDCFTKSLKEEPRHFESHYNLANLYFDVGNIRLARQHYEIAAQIEPEFPNLYFNLGLLLAIAEDFKAAIEALHQYKTLVSENEGDKADELLESLRRSLGVN